jgi:hypothetical protein
MLSMAPAVGAPEDGPVPSSVARPAAAGEAGRASGELDGATEAGSDSAGGMSMLGRPALGVASRPAVGGALGRLDELGGGGGGTTVEPRGGDGGGGGGTVRGGGGAERRCAGTFGTLCVFSRPLGGGGGGETRALGGPAKSAGGST